MSDIEDYQGNLIATLQRIQPLAGAAAAEFGPGAGRVTGLMNGSVQWLHAFDFSEFMLRVVQSKQQRNGWKNVSLGIPFFTRLPLSAVVPVFRSALCSGSRPVGDASNPRPDLT